MKPLIALHHSVKARPQSNRVPAKMSFIRMNGADVEFLTNVALELFTDACNAGLPFQDALLAVYLSALDHGRAQPAPRGPDPEGRHD